MQKLRKILFYLFATAYVVLCPLLIMYARGYIMKPGDQTQLVRTGALYVSTAPSGGEIYIGGEFSGKKTPNFIQGIVPGEQDLLLKLDGYLDWKMTIPFAAGKTTVIDTVLFVPEKRTIARVVPGKYGKMLEIRGAGNILGREQHGFIQSVGFDLYCRLLKQTIYKLTGDRIKERIFNKINN